MFCISRVYEKRAIENTVVWKFGQLSACGEIVLAIGCKFICARSRTLFQLSMTLAQATFVLRLGTPPAGVLGNRRPAQKEATVSQRARVGREPRSRTLVEIDRRSVLSLDGRGGWKFLAGAHQRLSRRAHVQPDGRRRKRRRFSRLAGNLATEQRRLVKMQSLPHIRLHPRRKPDNGAE